VGPMSLSHERFMDHNSTMTTTPVRRVTNERSTIKRSTIKPSTIKPSTIERRTIESRNRAKLAIGSLSYLVAIAVLASTKWFSTQSAWSELGIVFVLALIPVTLILLLKRPSVIAKSSIAPKDTNLGKADRARAPR